MDDVLSPNSRSAVVVNLVSKKQPLFEISADFQPAPKAWLPLWSLVLVVCSGCWSEPEVPAPLPVPVADPQIVPRPAPRLEAGDFAAVRQFRFFYDVTVTGLKPGEAARIWIPVAVDGAHQRVKRLLTEVPGKVQEGSESNFGNTVLYTEATADTKGEIPLRLTYEVERIEAMPNAGEPISEQSVDDSQLEGSLKDQPADIIARSAYDSIVQAQEIKPAGTEALVRGFVGYCRSQGVPATAEWGFTLGKNSSGTVEQPSGWAKFAWEGRWQMVDIVSARQDPAMASSAFGTLMPDRVHFSTGHNLALKPQPVAGELKRLDLPYVEVDGKRHEQLKTNFRYEDTTDGFE